MPSGAVASVTQPAAIHALSPVVRMRASLSKWKSRMRGQTFCHCSRSMLSSPVTARAQVPNATASPANIVRPAAKSLPRTAFSNVRSHSSGFFGVEVMAALSGGAPACQSTRLSPALSTDNKPAEARRAGASLTIRHRL